MTTATAQAFRTSIHDGKKYITTDYRGTEYCLMFGNGSYGVATRRLALGRFNAGGYKHFATLESVAAGCKAFGGMDNLMSLVYGIEA